MVIRRSDIGRCDAQADFAASLALEMALEERDVVTLSAGSQEERELSKLQQEISQQVETKVVLATANFFTE